MKSTIPAELQDDDLDEASDDMPSDLDSDEGQDGGEEVGDEDPEDASDQEEEARDDGSDEISLAEASDADDLLPLDTDIPEGLLEYDGSDVEQGDEDEEWGGIREAPAKPGKRKRGDEEKNKRKKLRSLPTFASYEDYAKLIEDGPEDNL